MSPRSALAALVVAVVGLGCAPRASGPAFQRVHDHPALATLYVYRPAAANRALAVTVVHVANRDAVVLNGSYVGFRLKPGKYRVQIGELGLVPVKVDLALLAGRSVFVRVEEGDPAEVVPVPEATALPELEDVVLARGGTPRYVADE